MPALVITTDTRDVPALVITTDTRDKVFLTGMGMNLEDIQSASKWDDMRLGDLLGKDKGGRTHYYRYLCADCT